MNSSNEHQRNHQPRADRIIQSLLKFSFVRHQSNSSDAANSKAKKIQDNAGQSAEPFRFWSLLKNVRTQSSAKNSVTPSRLRFRLPHWGFPSKNSSAANEMEKYNVTKTKEIPRRMSRTIFFSSIFCLAIPFVSKLFSVEAAYNANHDEINSTEEEFSDTARQSEDTNRERRQQNLEPSRQPLPPHSGAMDAFKKTLLPEDRLKKKNTQMIDPKLRKYLLMLFNREWISFIEQLEVEVFLESYVQRRESLGLFRQQDLCEEFTELFGLQFNLNTIIRFEKKELEPNIMLYYTRKLDQLLIIVEKLEEVYKENPQLTEYSVEKLAKKFKLNKIRLIEWFHRRKLRKQLHHCSLYY